jgi:hypothetical protein
MGFGRVSQDVAGFVRGLLGDRASDSGWTPAGKWLPRLRILKWNLGPLKMLETRTTFLTSSPWNHRESLELQAAA